MLEALLIETRGDAVIEVLNAGVGGTGPYNYRGTLRRNLDLDPDVYIAALYVGNDFTNTLQLHDFFEKRSSPPSTEADQRMVMGAATRWGRTIFGNGFNQAFKFKRQPDGAEIALRTAVDLYAEIASECADRDIAFVALIIPPKPAVDLHDDRERVAEILASIEMTEEEYGINMHLAERFVSELRTRVHRRRRPHRGAARAHRALLLAQGPPSQRARPARGRRGAARPGPARPRDALIERARRPRVRASAIAGDARIRHDLGRAEHLVEMERLDETAHHVRELGRGLDRPERDAEQRQDLAVGTLAATLDVMPFLGHRIEHRREVVHREHVGLGRARDTDRALARAHLELDLVQPPRLRASLGSMR